MTQFLFDGLRSYIFKHKHRPTYFYALQQYYLFHFVLKIYFKAIVTFKNQWHDPIKYCIFPRKSIYNFTCFDHICDKVIKLAIQFVPLRYSLFFLVSKEK